MKHNITFGAVVESYLDDLLVMGIYGRTKSEIVRRFTEAEIAKLLHGDVGNLIVSVHKRRLRQSSYNRTRRRDNA
jgi:hypothetical protein